MFHNNGFPSDSKAGDANKANGLLAHSPMMLVQGNHKQKLKASAGFTPARRARLCPTQSCCQVPGQLNSNPGPEAGVTERGGVIQEIRRANGPRRDSVVCQPPPITRKLKPPSHICQLIKSVECARLTKKKIYFVQYPKAALAHNRV